MSVKKIEGYTIFMQKILGSGTYGKVYLGKKVSNGQQVAVKILSKDSIDRDQYLKAAFKNQIDILQKLHSDNIVGFFDVMESSKNYYIIQQLCDGDLESDIKLKNYYQEEEAIQLLRQICNGFLALVKEGVIHRDLKPANIMKKSKILKLGDFGFAKKMGKKSMVSTTVGTPLYMSLQVLKGQEYTSKCDIWALGFIFYEILHGTTPWTANTEVQLVRNIQKIPLEIKRKDISNECQDFIRRCLQLKQNNRISWDEIFVHSIFKGYFESKNDSKEFENKMKMIMNKLRFYISHKNLDMKKIMDSFGFGNGKQQINYQDFYHFFLRVYPQITNQQTDYLFKKTDTDHSQSISVQQLKNILIQNGIKIHSQFDIVPSFQKRQDGKQTFKRISIQTSNKIKNCFQKLYKIINKNNLTLWKVFNDFDNKKGSLTISQFTLLVKKICDNYIDITQDQIKSGFNLIDQDSSNFIQFTQFDKYYSKINGVPQSGVRKYDPRLLDTSNKIKRQLRKKQSINYQLHLNNEDKNKKNIIFCNYSTPSSYNPQKNNKQIQLSIQSSSHQIFNPFKILAKKL